MTLFNKLFHDVDTILVACSGGADSTFLLHELYKKFSAKLIIVHMNHEWWPSDTEAEAFVKSIAHQYSLPIHISYLSEWKKILSKGSREDHARRVRRAFFDTLLQQYPNSVVALGHTADDQIETLLLRLSRGTTVSGLAGIAVEAGRYVRPLLKLRKKEILKLLQEKNISFVDDTANNDEVHARVRLRKTVVPALESVEPRFFQRCLESMERFAQAEKFIQHTIRTMYHQVIVSNELHPSVLRLDLFMQYEPFVRYRIILQWLIENTVSFDPQESLLKEVDRFLVHKNFNAIHSITPSFSIHKRADHAWIEKK